MSDTATQRISALLRQIYPAEEAAAAEARIHELIARVKAPAKPDEGYFSEQSITLITYGDSLRRPGEPPLKTLHHFLQSRLQSSISNLHILPFYPYSSDDGFSVIDYYAIDPQLGDWEHVRALSAEFRLMFDAVINHMSAQSEWFRAFLAADPAYAGLFFTENPATDLSLVTRPRTSPLLTEFARHDGTPVHVWTTFSADQVDLDYRNPRTLLRILEVLLFYVEQGAQALRLDAIAYLWKVAGTSCIHLPQTHQVIQVMRAVLDIVAPQVVLITETNVPHRENLSYFGDGSIPEAQLVYNFTLPPLLFYTLLSRDARPLADWVNSLEARPAGTAFFNFTASHDGIGVRPVEGILSKAQIQQLIDKCLQSGGEVSYKINPDQTQSPYELNISYVDAVTHADEPPDLQARAFLVSQGVMLALAGVPAIYIHSLLGSRNDLEGMRQAGYKRAINRRKLLLDDLLLELDDPQRFRARIFSGYTHLIQRRAQSKAFHPNAPQRAKTYHDGQVFALERVALDDSETVLCLFNITNTPQTIDTPLHPALDLLTDEPAASQLVLAPYQIRWLQRKS